MSADQPDQSKKAETFRRLHRGARILILPNAWDVASARLFEDACFAAVATSSAGLMVSLGYPDGEAIALGEFIAATGGIARALSVPLSADIVGGFGRSPKDVVSTVRSVIEAGAIGINIEDSIHETKELLPIPAQVERLKAIRKLREALDVPFVINGRTDVLLHARGGLQGRVAGAIRRGMSYRDVGVDCLYPMGLTDPESIAAFVQAVEFP